MGTRQDRRRQSITAFLERRTPQHDHLFVAECGVAALPRGADVALAVRQAVGRSCDVDPQYIRATDGFSHELYLLWGEDSLDAIEFWIDLQERLPYPIPDSDAERVRQPFSGDVTVAEFVRNVLAVLRPNEGER